MPLGFVIHPHFPRGLCERELTTEKSTARAPAWPKNRTRDLGKHISKGLITSRSGKHDYFTEEEMIRGNYAGAVSSWAVSLGMLLKLEQVAEELIFQGNFEGFLLWLLDP